MKASQRIFLWFSLLAIMVVGIMAINAGLAMTLLGVAQANADGLIFIKNAILLLGIAGLVYLIRRDELIQLAQAQVDRRLSQACLDEIVEMAGDAIVIVDEKQHIQRYNRAAEEIFGYSSAEITGQPLDLLIPPRYQELHRRQVEHFGAAGSAHRRMGQRVSLSGRRKDGSTFPCEISISSLDQKGRSTYTAIVRDITERVAANQLLEKRVAERTREIEEQRRYAERLAEENAELAAQAESLAVLRERNRLARDMHDSVTQMVYSQTLLAEAGRRLAQQGDLAQAQSYLARLAELASQTLKEMRLMIYELRSPALENEGLVGALQQRVDAVEGKAGLETRLLVEGDVHLPPRVEEGLFWIAQEALNNSLKHAEASLVTVRIQAQDDALELEVRDNGKGAELSQEQHPGSMGLTNMRERARQMGGALTIRSTPGEGTSVKIRVEMASST